MRPVGRRTVVAGHWCRCPAGLMFQISSRDPCRPPLNGASLRKRVRIFRRAIKRRPSLDGRCRPLVQMSRRSDVNLKFPGPLPTFPTLGFDPGRRTPPERDVDGRSLFTAPSRVRFGGTGPP